MTIQEYMYRCFRKAGMTAAGACATLAQIQHESAFRPNNAEDSKGIADDVYTKQVDDNVISRSSFVYDAIGYGYAQWTHSSRKALMYDYHRSRGKSIGDSDTQISFLIWEMQKYFPVQWKLVTTSDDLEKCTWELLDKWENPSEKTENMKRRYRDAKDFYQRFSAIDVNGASGTTADDAIQTVLELAKAEIGYKEKASNSQLDDKTANAGSGNWTKYARDLAKIGNFYNGNKNGYAWCDVFYDWLFAKSFGAETGRQMLCQPYNSAGAGCLYSAQYYKQAGRFFNDPQPGDQIFFTYAAGEVSHTGIVETVISGMITTIEGNTSDQVARRTYSRGSASIYGFGRPKWDLAAQTDSAVIFDPAGDPDRVLKKGTSGMDVKQLQEDLISLGYDLGSWGADGDFGDATYRVVVKFQKDHGLVPEDGEVGVNTRKALTEALKQNGNESDSGNSNVTVGKLQVRELRQDMEGSDVKLAQAALCCWGYTILVTGIFGKEMDTKIRDFQERSGLTVDGIIGPMTWRALLKVPETL